MAFDIYASENNNVLVRDLLENVETFNKVEVNTKTSQGQLDAFNKSSVVQTAIRKRSDAFSHLEIWAKDDNGKKIINNDVVKNDLKLLSQPNEYQNFNCFNNHVESQVCIYGRCYIYKSKIIGINKFNFYIIPFDMVSPVYSNTYNSIFEKEILYYNINIGSRILRLETDDVFIYRDNWYKNGQGTFGLSRLYSLSEPISTLLSIGETITQLIVDGGARGIIGQGAKDIDTFSAPFLTREKIELQKSLQEYGGLRGKFKYIITKGAASYIPLTSKIVDMQLPELLMSAKISVFEQFGLPNIFAAEETRYKSLPEARKEFYTGTIIPEATKRFSDFCKMMSIPNRDWEYKPDWSHLDFYQEDLKESAIALQQVSGAITPLVEKGIITIEQAKGILEPYLY